MKNQNNTATGGRPKWAPRGSPNDEQVIQERKSTLMQSIQARATRRDTEQVELGYEETCQELKNTKRHYDAFRKKVEKLNLDKIMDNEKSFSIFGGGDAVDLDQNHLAVNEQTVDPGLEGGQQSNGLAPQRNLDKSVLFEIKQYKNMHPDDIHLFKGLKLKISNYLLQEADKMQADTNGQRVTNVGGARMSVLEAKYRTQIDKKVMQLSIQPRVLNYNNSVIDQSEFIESSKREFIRLNSKIDELDEENKILREAKSLIKNVFESIKIMDK